MEIGQIAELNESAVNEASRVNLRLYKPSSNELSLRVVLRYYFGTSSQSRLFRHKSWPSDRFVYFKDWYIAMADLSKQKKPQTQLQKELVRHNALDIEMQPKYGWLEHRLSIWQSIKFLFYKQRTK
jgi:hypothetical protein